MSIDRRRFIKGAGVAGIAGLAGCAGGPQGSPTPEETTEPADGGGSTDGGTETATPGDPTNIGMVYATGGLGDGSFNDQAQQGLQEAAEDFDVSFDEAQPGAVSEFKNFQQQFAQSTNPTYELVACIGFLQTEALQQTSANYQDQNFMIVDSVVDSDNVASYVFREHEGSFLVGVLAGMLTTMSFSAGAGSTKSDSTNVGFVGGVEGSLIKKFEAGYTAGVKNANDDVDVQSTYTGSFNDPSAGKEAALAQYDSGADIVYHAAGNTGTGVFQAAQERGRFAIGVDRRQSITRPKFADVILASMVKRVDTAVYNAVESVVNDEFAGGSVTTLGLPEEGVQIVYGDQLGSEIPQSVKDQIASARQGIIDGDISVPTDPKNV